MVGRQNQRYRSFRPSEKEKGLPAQRTALGNQDFRILLVVLNVVLIVLCVAVAVLLGQLGMLFLISLNVEVLGSYSSLSHTLVDEVADVAVHVIAVDSCKIRVCLLIVAYGEYGAGLYIAGNSDLLIVLPERRRIRAV